VVDLKLPRQIANKRSKHQYVHSLPHLPTANPKRNDKPAVLVVTPSPNLEHVHETGISRIKGRAARNPASQDYADVLDAVTSAYRILLTRAIKGLFVWCEDEETRGYLQKRLSEASELS
jgi:hypothetical protein